MEHGDWELSIQPRLAEPVPAETLLQGSSLHLPRGPQSPEGNSSDRDRAPGPAHPALRPRGTEAVPGPRAAHRPGESSREQSARLGAACPQGTVNKMKASRETETNTQ